jgi:hypothetical protein
MKKIPLSRALILIFLSVIAISGTAFLALLYTQAMFEKKNRDPTFAIKEIKLEGPKRGALSKEYFEALLSLSADKPTNLNELSIQQTESLLLSSPVISKANCKKIFPSTLAINYRLKTPIAKLLDYEDSLIDSGGTLMPYSPFYEERRLPEIYLGIKPYGETGGATFGKKILDERLFLALDVMDTIHSSLNPTETRIVRVDVSESNSQSFGRRRIVVILQERQPGSENFLLLSQKNLKEGLEKYSSLKPYLTESQNILELRLKQLAYIR